MNKYVKILIAVSILLIISVAGNIYQYYKPIPITTITDTVTISKIEIQEKIRYKTLLRVDTVRDTIKLASNDTIINIPIPITQNTYTDTLLTDTSTLIIGAKYSGYKSSLDSLWYNYTYKPKEALKSKKKGKFGHSIVIGIQAGYGVGLKPFNAEPYIGVGITYGFGITW
jgi:hypothetical protein